MVSGDVVIANAEISTLKATSNGSGSIAVSGSAKTADLTTTGSGDISVRQIG